MIETTWKGGRVKFVNFISPLAKGHPTKHVHWFVIYNNITRATVIYV